jgi:haloalkane dehalogenase
VAEAFRTPGERFTALPEFNFEPSYRIVGDLRLAHVDIGDGPPVVMLHGEPAWGFIWRRVVPPVVDAGYRCIVPDRVRRIVTLDTVIDPREAWMSELWVRFREFVETTEDFPAGEIMQATCSTDLPDEVIAAYDAPFPRREAKAALTGLPMCVPRVGPDEPVLAYEEICEGLRRDRRPMLILWGKDDLILTVASGERLASRIGRKIDHLIPHAGHGLQEDQGPLVGGLIVDWLASGPT